VVRTVATTAGEPGEQAMRPLEPAGTGA